MSSEFQIVDLPESVISYGEDCVLVQDEETREVGRKILTSSNGDFLAEHPINSLIFLVNNVDPNAYGGVWELVGVGRALWGVGANEQAGVEQDGEVPNIKGSGNFICGDDGTNNSPFYEDQTISNRVSGAGNRTNCIIDFSRSNPKYTDNNIVKPESYAVHMWRRVS